MNARFFAAAVFLAVLLLSEAVSAQMLSVPEGDLAGSVIHHKVRKKDTLYSIARQHDVGIVELMAANPGVDPWVPKAGGRLVIPSSHVLPPAGLREGIVINLASLRLFYFYDPQTVMTFPVGIGMDGWLTPTGATRIVKKRKDPSWRPPDSIRQEDPALPEEIPPGPGNPLGGYALNLGWQGYLIHGTNRPYGIGKRSSHGCIRLYPEDVSLLFDLVEEGTPVTIVDMPFMLGWRGRNLYLEVPPSPLQADRLARHKEMELSDLPEAYYAVKQEAAPVGALIDWRAVTEAVIWRTGLPVVVARR